MDLFLLVATLSFCSLATAQDGIPDGQGLNWYESLPAVAMDYKVHIDAGEWRKRWSWFSFVFNELSLVFRQGRLLSSICSTRRDVLCLHAGGSRDQTQPSVALCLFWCVYVSVFLWAPSKWKFADNYDKLSLYFNLIIIDGEINTTNIAQHVFSKQWSVKSQWLIRSTNSHCDQTMSSIQSK